VTLLGLALMIVFLMPLGYMITTAFKLDAQASAQNAPLYGKGHNVQLPG
jgi:hypothetical protein